MNDISFSVAMAAFNGEKYIAEQIESILPQLRESDELVVSINPSTDRTKDIVEWYRNKDHRIQISICNTPGVLANFENAIRQCKNEIIFLSDQDDVWAKEKVEKQLKKFGDASIGGVCHGCKYIDGEGYLMEIQPEQGLNREIKFWEILKKNPVQGSTLAFRKELTNYFLPFPKDIPMHDSWIGLWICSKSELIYMNDPLLLYRQHEGTVTTRKHKSIRNMAIERLHLLQNYVKQTKKVYLS